MSLTLAVRKVVCQQGGGTYRLQFYSRIEESLESYTFPQIGSPRNPKRAGDIFARNVCDDIYE